MQPSCIRSRWHRARFFNKSLRRYAGICCQFLRAIIVDLILLHKEMHTINCNLRAINISCLKNSFYSCSKYCSAEANTAWSAKAVAIKNMKKMPICFSFHFKYILNQLENSGLKSRLLFCLIFQFYLMYRLICQKPAHFLSAQMALVSTFFQMFILGMYNFDNSTKMSHQDVKVASNGKN